MLVRYGQVDPGTSAAITAPEPPVPGFTPIMYFGLAVAAGLTVWLVTKILDKK
jgi:hypothetical protein